MEERYRTLLQNNIARLIKDLEPKKVSRQMGDVLDDEDFENIRSLKTRHEQSEAILDISPRTRDKAFRIIEALKKVHLVGCLINEFA